MESSFIPKTVAWYVLAREKNHAERDNGDKQENGKVTMNQRAPAWNTVMTAAPGEQDLEIPASVIEGMLPPELAGGRHLQNGPGWTKIGDHLAHPFDGHGFWESAAR